MKEDQKRGRPARQLPAFAAIVLALACLSVLYGMKGREAKLGLDAHAQNAVCAAAAAAALRVGPLVVGEMAAMLLPKPAAPMPELIFDASAGAVKNLSDFRGRTVLLNLWATWCIPCREEMPALDRLQQELGSAEFEVVAVNIDTARLEKRQAFLDSVGVKSLAFYADPKADVFQTLRAKNKVEGLPTSWLIGKDGCEIGMLGAKADWSSPDALALIRAALQ